MLPQVLGKCLHFQVLPLDTVLHTLAEPDQEDGQHQGDDEGVYSLLDIGFIQLKIYLHTNLPLDAVLRKSTLRLLPSSCQAKRKLYCEPDGSTASIFYGI